MKTEFPDPANLLQFTLTITPDEGSLALTVPPRSDSGLTTIGCRNVQRRRVCLYLQHQHQLSTRPAQGQVHPEGPSTSLSIFPQPGVDIMLTGPFGMKLYHPNVDIEGNVCLNILREDWKPVLNLQSVMIGLQYLFLEPNSDDPLNKGKEKCLLSCRTESNALMDVVRRGGRRPASRSPPVCAKRQAESARRAYQKRDL